MRYLPLVCLIGVLLGAAPQAAPAPTVGSAFDVAPQADATVGQLNPSAAFNGTDTYLVVWESGWEGEDLSTDIMAARVRSDGTLLDPAGFVVCSAPDIQQRPMVAWGGGQFFVAWQDLRSGNDFDIYGTRVSADGRVLDPGGVLLYGGANNQVQPALASDGNAFCLAWSGFTDNYHVYLGRVSAAGQPLDGPSGIVADRNNPKSSSGARIAWTGTHWFVTWGSYGAGSYDTRTAPFWSEMGQIFAATWTPALAPSGVAVKVKAGSFLHHPALGSDGGTMLSVWSKGWLGRGGPGPVVGRRITTDPSGNVGLLPLQGIAPELNSRHHVAATSNGLWLVCFAARRTVGGTTHVGRDVSLYPHILGVRVRSSDGALLDGGNIFNISPATTRPQRNPTVAGGLSGQFLVVYETDRGIKSRRLEARFVTSQ